MSANRMELNSHRRARPVSAGRFPRLDAELDARGWTLADLCRAAGVPYPRLSRTVAGHFAASNDTQLRTARALALKPWQLWEKESEPKPEAAPSGADRG
jgi:lambda repressor-like predicted transcriptional regulator